MSRYPIPYVSEAERCRCDRVPGRHSIGHPHLPQTPERATSAEEALVGITVLAGDLARTPAIRDVRPQLLTALDALREAANLLGLYATTEETT